MKSQSASVVLVAVESVIFGICILLFGYTYIKYTNIVKLNSNLKEEIKKIDNDNNKLQDSVNDINSKIDEEEKIKKDEVEVYQSWKKLKETLTEALSH